MTRRTSARRKALLTFSAQPWTLFEDDPNAGGGGGGGNGPQLNDHGFPDATPVADMAPEHQVAYWKHQSRKHEARANAVPTAEELEKLRADAAELATRKASELTETERLQAEAATAKAEAEAAKAQAAEAAANLVRLQVAAAKGLTPEQATRLQGSTKEELEADADALRAMFGPAGGDSGAPTGGAPHLTPSGREPGTAKTVAAGASRYKSPYGGTN